MSYEVREYSVDIGVSIDYYICILFYLKCSFENPKHTMKYLDFCESVRLKLNDLVDSGTTVRIQKVLKNNNIVRYAAIITEEDSTISPSIYLENYYSDYINGQSLSYICSDILSMHKKYRGGINFNIDDYFDYNFVKDKIYLKAINRERNEEFLKGVPYKDFSDLAIVAYIAYEDEGSGYATITLNYKNLEMWDVTTEQIFDIAFKNMCEKTPPILEKITSVMRELLNERFKYIQDSEAKEEINRVIDLMEENNDTSMYMLSNNKKINGASYIIHEEYIREFAQSINSDLYIIPSSIHELLLIPMDSGVMIEELECMVRDVNNSELSPGEVLSDRVYEFYRDKGFVDN